LCKNKNAPTDAGALFSTGSNVPDYKFKLSKIFTSLLAHISGQDRTGCVEAYEKQIPRFARNDIVLQAS
jgi:hypothetical protein